MTKTEYRSIIVILFLTLVSFGLVLTICAIELKNDENQPVIIEQNICTLPEIEQVEQIKENYYNITEEERYLLAKLAHSEASICSQECQEAVVSVVFNRLESGKWRKDMNNDGVISLYDIIYYPHAFTPATNGAIDRWEPTSKDYAAVDAVLANGPTVPTYVRYFRAGHHFNSWDGYNEYCSIDNVYFGYFTNWKQGAW